MDHAMLNLKLDSYWLNMGLWTDGIQCFPDACENLAKRVVANGQRIRAGDRVLDFGSGCGDQLLLWKRLQPNSAIQTVTAERAQADLAYSRIKNLNLDATISVFHGDALDQTTWTSTSLNAVKEPSLWNERTVDSVISLDACYHFNTRTKFLHIAASKLKPQTGLLSLSDIILKQDQSQLSTMDQVFLKLFCGIAGVPPVNLITLSEYSIALEEAGFEHVEIHDVTDNVFPGLERFIDSQGGHMGTLLNSTRWMQYGFGMKMILGWIIQKRVFSFVVVHANKRSQ
ncbi:S-adenosyl-L-methionine-dependent methyltransferase [Obelidium mucronatum]|nr:S-adenosyl-L-methionine-dependent methyltransferase [Obelidium mucronatum]